MKDEELKMLRQFVDTVFDLTHALDNDTSLKGKDELVRTIGSLAFSAQRISDLYQRGRADND